MLSYGTLMALDITVAQVGICHSDGTVTFPVVYGDDSGD